MSLPDQLLLLLLPAPSPDSILLCLLDNFLKLPPKQAALAILPGDDLRLLGEFNLEGLILLLVALVLGKQRLESIDLLVLLADGALNLGDHALLLPNPVDVHLVSLQLHQKRHLLGLRMLPHGLVFEFKYNNLVSPPCIPQTDL